MSPVGGLRSQSSHSAPSDIYRPILPRQDSGNSSGSRPDSTPSLQAGDDVRIELDIPEAASQAFGDEVPGSNQVLDIDALCEEYLDKLTLFCPFVSRSRCREVIDFLLKSNDACCRSLLTAYILATRFEEDSRRKGASRAREFYGQGTRLLRESIATSGNTCSDSDIQAVLLLIAYAADSGSYREVSIHLEALARMIRQRAGQNGDQAVIDPHIALQMKALPHSKVRHLTLDCEPECVSDSRFSEGIAKFDEILESIVYQKEKGS